MRIALLSSTGASVAKVAQSFLPAGFGFDYVFTDRECPAEQFARDNRLPYERISESNGSAFSDKLLLSMRKQQISYLVIFFTRLLKGQLLSEYDGRLINFHPSLLPACAGQRGFEDTMASGALFFGSTVHLVDSGMDTGQPLLQVIGKKQPGGDLRYYRHQVFSQQVASLFQLMIWLRAGRLVSDSRGYFITNADYRANSLANPCFEPEAEQVYQTVLSRFA